MAFNRDLRLVSTRGGRWRLLASLVWQDEADGIVIQVPEGYCTDLFSVPRVLWWLFPRDHRGRRAAALHDYVYSDLQGRFTRAEADRIFRRALAWCGVGPITRWVMWAGVRLGGWVAWHT